MPDADKMKFKMPKADASIGSNEQARRWRARLRKALRILIVAVLVLGGGCWAYNFWARSFAQREAERIATTAYGEAFETRRFAGDGGLGVLFLHGLYGTPADFSAIMAALRAEQVGYYAPMLGGDRPSPLVQMGFTRHSLAAHAEQAYAELAAGCAEIVVVGFSLGAVQAADLARRRPVKAVVLVSPAFGLTRRWPVRLETWAAPMARLTPIIPRSTPGIVNDPGAKAEYRGIRATCLTAAAALVDYADEVRPHLAQGIKAPVLCVLSRGDEVIDPDAAAGVIAEMTAAKAEVVWFSRSNHNPLVDYDRAAANARITAFILSLRE